MQNKPTNAGKIAAGMAAYLVLGWLQIVTQLSFGAFSYPLYPALMALILPAPFLGFFHLADSSPWVGTWPNTGGFFVLFVVYTYVTYFMAKRLGGCAEKR
jgi:hypothetical protein